MAINKVCESFDEAVADIPDGAVILLGGFGGIAPLPQNLILALSRKGVKDLTLISNNAGGDGRLGIGNIGGKPYVDHEILVRNGQVKKFIGAVPASIIASRPNAFEELYREGKVELELVPQGTLAERIRAGGAGIGAFYTPTGVGTVVEVGKEKRVIAGREMLLEYALRADFALIRAHTADTLGNLSYHGVMRTFNAVMAMAADVVIAEVDEIVEAGDLDPEVVVTPGIFIDRIVKTPRG
jgi:3-oxoacid CoA-transferase A subunit